MTLARVSPRRNNRSRAQTSIFAIENRMSSTRARRQEARKCRPEEFSARMKSFNSHCFFQYFCSPAPVHEGMNNTKTIHFLLIFFQYFCSPALGHEGRKSTQVIHFLFFPQPLVDGFSKLWLRGKGNLGVETLISAGSGLWPCWSPCSLPKIQIWEGVISLHKFITKSVISGSKWPKLENFEIWNFGES